GIKQLEFGFKAGSASKTWHLDDVSIIDKNASNSEKLVNGGFENGTLTGWQVLCSTINCGTKAGNITQSNCHTGSYCYEDYINIVDDLCIIYHNKPNDFFLSKVLFPIVNDSQCIRR
ncbi:unnamed protein product, partial [Rotaria sordida]